MNRIDRLEELPSGERMHNNKYHHSWDGVPFSRIRNWIRSNVGNSYESTLSKWVSLEWVPYRIRNRTGFNNYVDTEIISIDGTFYHARGCYGRLSAVDGGYSKGVYLNPITNKLAAAVPRRRVERSDQYDGAYVRIGDYQHYCKINGIWYEVKLRESYVSSTVYFDGGAYKLRYHTNITPKNTPLLLRNPFNVNKFLISKRQLASRKLKELGLKNEPS